MEWFFADREARLISPSSSISVKELVRHLADQDTLEPLTKALELAPSNPTVLVRRAWNVVNDWKLSESHKERAEWLSWLAVILAPTDGAIWALRADVLAAIGNESEAQQALARALELSPDDPNAWWVKAFLLKWAGQEEHAYAAFLKSLELVSNTSSQPRPKNQSFIHGALREFRTLGELDAEKLAKMAKTQPERLEPRNRIEADWLSRRAVELAADSDKNGFWLRRAEVL